MKKLTILTSILALAACGGGSGGGGGYVGGGHAGAVPGGAIGITQPGVVEGAVSGPAVDSNAYVTGMVSQILTTDDNDASISIGLSRAASTKIHHKGKDYTKSYDISDVDFNLTDEGFGGTFRFVVDKNKKITHFDMIDDDKEVIMDAGVAYIDAEIDAESEIQMAGDRIVANPNVTDVEVIDNEDGSYTYKKGGEVRGIYFIKNDLIVKKYDGPTITVDGETYAVNRFERNGDKEFTFGGTTQGVEGKTQSALTYNSRGKELQLKYSDFGYFKLVADEDLDRPIMIAGGYDTVKRVDVANAKNAKFTGEAAASVVAIRDGNGSGMAYDPNNNGGVIYGAATLTVDEKGTETLAVNFNDWYDVSYNNSEKSATFSNYKASGNVTAVVLDKETLQDTTTLVSADDFRMISHDDNGFTIKNESVYDEEEAETVNTINSDFRYYGDKNIASEAVGLIQVVDCGGGVCGNDYEAPTVRLNMSFGGKR